MTSDTPIRRGIAAIGWLLLAYLLVYHAREATKIYTWMQSGFRESQMSRISARPPVIVFLTVVRGDFEETPYPSTGDTVVAIGGRPADAWSEHPWPASQPLQVTFVHAGDTLTSSFAMRVPAWPLVWGSVLCALLRFLVSFLSLGVGLWVLRRPGVSPAVRVFALYSFALAAMVSLYYYFFPGSYATFSIPFQVQWFRLWFFFGGLYGGLWLHVLYLYPRPLNWVRRHPFWAYTLCYLPGLMQVFLWVNALAEHPLLLALAYPERATLLSTILAPLPVWVSLLILLRRYLTSADRLEGRQLRLILWAVATGTVVQSVIALMNHVSPLWFNARFFRPLSLSTLTFTALLLGPLSFAYAFRKYRLMDVEAKLRRGTRYALITGALVAASLGLTFLFSEIVLANLGITSRTPSLALAFALALGILPAQKRLNRLLEKRVYPERARMRQMLHSFLDQASTLLDQQTFWQELERRLAESMKVESVRPVLFDQDEGPFISGSALRQYLLTHRLPLPVDEALASGRIEVSRAEAEWLAENHVGLLLPLVRHQQLLGFLGIGLRTDGEDYGVEELQILNSLAPQIAVAVENLRLLEENVGKKRLEEELALARRTQENLLPQRLPLCPGLEVEAVCRFCLEVAGDYYDVIPLSAGKTALAIADVSGKGAAAALLMANLQASLRMGVQVSEQLDSVVAGINELICRNTRPEQFITFFVGIFDPATQTLTYVNAGHNSPMVVHQHGPSEFLHTGGLILGIMPDMTYQMGAVQLARNDLLLLYTDGVSEAMNKAETLFGEERIQQLLEQGRRLPLPAILANLESAVVAHHGGATFEDDFTLLVARVTG
jgi:sigma-B regulation protein RsbU (phosphoserine phosphatase)